MSRLQMCSSVDELSALLGTTYQKIRYFYYVIDISSSYRVFEVSKKNGGSRTISAPSERLKVLQLRLKDLLAELYTPKSYVMGFVEGRSIVDNARVHTRKKFVFNIDLQDFFPSITFSRIRGLLMSKPYSLNPSVATVIAHLTTINGSLPQGGACSPLLSNMICASMDRRLKGLAAKNRAQYTRYADDITFSFYDDLDYISENVVRCLKGDGLPNGYFVECGDDLERVVRSSGFKVNRSKVRMQSRHERQVVTGLVVNKKPNVDRCYIRKTSAMIHSVEVRGVVEARALFARKMRIEGGASLDAHLHGRILFIKQVVGVGSQVYHRLALRFNSLDLKFKVPLGVSKSKFGGEVGLYTRWYSKMCWVVEADNGSDIDLELFQGSGFMIPGHIIVTCAHVVMGGGGLFKNIIVYQASKRSKTYGVDVVFFDKNKDIALLKISDSNQDFEFGCFDIERESFANIGEEVSVLGFPNDKVGAVSVGSQKATVRNRFPLHGVVHCELDKELYAGNSGGPVLNDRSFVVGVVGVGNDGKYCDHSRFICVSELISVLSSFEGVEESGSLKELVSS